MDKNKYQSAQHARRKRRIRKKIFGDTERPRLTVYRSLRHIYAQVIDDMSGNTLVAASTLSEETAKDVKQTGNVEAATKIGDAVAKKALAVGIRRVRFDRNGFRYHGRIKALAEAARKGGLAF